MAWLRIDDGFMEHPKVLALKPRELAVHLRALCYAARRRDPHITPGTIPILVATATDVERLVELGLWDVNGDGWVIHDWDEYQPRPLTNSERQTEYRRRNGGVTNE